MNESTQDYNKIIIWLALEVLLLLGFMLFVGTVLYTLHSQMKPTYIHKEVRSQKADDSIYMTIHTGTASYYSEDGCIGCSPNMIMANGQPFDEDAYTLASNDIPLGKWVTVINTDTGTEIEAQVTDRGGFDELGRIADLSKGLKEALQCRDLCNIKIYERYE